MSKPHFSETMQSVLSDLLSYELDKAWSRESATLAATKIPLPLGTVLQAGDSGLEVVAAAGVASAVLARNVEKSTAAQSTLVFVRGCILKESALRYPDGYQEADKAEAVQELIAASILVK